jgi:hypothetical protein
MRGSGPEDALPASVEKRIYECVWGIEGDDRISAKKKGLGFSS